MSVHFLEGWGLTHRNMDGTTAMLTAWFFVVAKLAEKAMIKQ
jgi:hypothetical protein